MHSGWLCAAQRVEDAGSVKDSLVAHIQPDTWAQTLSVTVKVAYLPHSTGTGRGRNHGFHRGMGLVMWGLGGLDGTQPLDYRRGHLRRCKVPAEPVTQS